MKRPDSTLAHDSDFWETAAPPTPTSWQPLPFVLEFSFSIPSALMRSRYLTWHPRQFYIPEQRVLDCQMICANYPHYRLAVSPGDLLRTT